MSAFLDVGQALQTFIQDMVRKTNPATQEEVMALRNQLYAAMEAYFTQMLEDMRQSDVEHISANDVIVELVDSGSGQLYRRPVELRFEENENGIVLTGEDMSGRSSSIVFLSDAYMKKLTDISGKGPDEHKCDS